MYFYSYGMYEDLIIIGTIYRYSQCCNRRYSMVKQERNLIGKCFSYMCLFEQLQSLINGQG